MSLSQPCGAYLLDNGQHHPCRRAEKHRYQRRQPTDRDHQRDESQPGLCQGNPAADRQADAPIDNDASHIIAS